MSHRGLIFRYAMYDEPRLSLSNVPLNNHGRSCSTRSTLLRKCNTSVLTPGIEIVHDVCIIFESWQGAQGQGPAIDWLFSVQVIKVDAYGCGVESDTAYFDVSCNYGINKIA